MQKYGIVTGTVTYAIKGRDILRKSGYPTAKVIKMRAGGNYGCGYAIQVFAENNKEIERLLRENSIKILKII